MIMMLMMMVIVMMMAVMIMRMIVIMMVVMMRSATRLHHFETFVKKPRTDDHNTQTRQKSEPWIKGVRQDVFLTEQRNQPQGKYADSMCQCNYCS